MRLIDPDKHGRLADFLITAAAVRPGHPALIVPAATTTFEQLLSEARNLAHHLAANGTCPGSRVFLAMANSPAFAVAFWAVQLAGATAVPVNPATKPDKLAFMIGDAEPVLVIADPEIDIPDGPAVIRPAKEGQPFDHCTGAAPLPATARPDDLAAIIYTSGSTGNPKGVMLTQRNMVTAACSVASYLGYREDERIFCAIPFTFDYGLHQITMSALVGCSLIVERDFSQPLMSLNRMARSNATALPLVPTMAVLVNTLARRFDLSAIRIVTNTAAALGSEVIDGLRHSFPKARLFSMYGLTECHRCTFLAPEELEKRKTSVGKAIPFTEMWVVDDEGIAHRSGATGELVISGDTVMAGYWRNEKATSQRLRPGPDGRMVLHTGDLCRLDDEGFCYFVGRRDEMLKVRGHKVAPAEIEAALARHPRIALAAITGHPDPVLGTCLTAHVEPETGARLGEDEVAAHAASTLELHLRPARIVIVPVLPRTANGKIDKRALAAAAAMAPVLPSETSHEELSHEHV